MFEYVRYKYNKHVQYTVVPIVRFSINIADFSQDKIARSVDKIEFGNRVYIVATYIVKNRHRAKKRIGQN